MNRTEILNKLLEYKKYLIEKHESQIAIVDALLYEERERPQPTGVPYRKYMRGWHESQW